MKKKAQIKYNNQMENFKMIYVLWFIKMLKKCLIWFSKYFSSIPLHLCFFQFQFDTQIYNFYIKTTYFFKKSIDTSCLDFCSKKSQFFSEFMSLDICRGDMCNTITLLLLLLLLLWWWWRFIQPEWTRRLLRGSNTWANIYFLSCF